MLQGTVAIAPLLGSPRQLQNRRCVARAEAAEHRNWFEWPSGCEDSGGPIPPHHPADTISPKTASRPRRFAAKASEAPWRSHTRHSARSLEFGIVSDEKVVINDKREVAGSCNPNSHRNRRSYHETCARGGGSCILRKLPFDLQHYDSVNLEKCPLSADSHFEPRNPAMPASVHPSLRMTMYL